MQKPTLDPKHVMEVFFGCKTILSFDHDENVNTTTDEVSEPENFNMNIEQMSDIVDLAFSTGYLQGKAIGFKLAQKTFHIAEDKEKANSELREEFEALILSLTNLQKRILNFTD